MTRINCGISVQKLTRQHLIAEHREIIRIPNCVKKGRFNLKNQPKQFTLGQGHVKFFYTRLKYLHDRYLKIYAECVNRGYNVQDFSSSFENIPAEFYNDYTPTKEDVEIVSKRIIERDGTV